MGVLNSGYLNALTPSTYRCGTLKCSFQENAGFNVGPDFSKLPQITFFARLTLNFYERYDIRPERAMIHGTGTVHQCLASRYQIRVVRWQATFRISARGRMMT